MSVSSQTNPGRALRRGNARTKGLVAAIAVAALSGVGLWFVASAPKRAQAPKIQAQDIGQAPTAENELNGSDITLQLVDRNDPGRLAAELKLPAIQPLEAKRYAVQTPSGWLYPRDGRIVWIRADKADLFLPNRQQLPERGDFRGNVIVRLFEGPAGRKFDPEKETPLLEAKTEHMAFDGAVGELQIPERLLITGSGLSYAGKNVRALFNDPEQRLELLTAASSEYLRYDPKRAREQPSLWAARNQAPSSRATPTTPTSPTTPTGPTSPSANATTGANAGAPSPKASRPGRESRYSVRAQQNVRAAQGQREIRSDVLEVFARLIDNQTPRRLEVGASQRPDAYRVTPASFRQPEGSPLPARPAVTSRGSNDDPVEVVWSGPLEVRPIGEGEELLNNNDLAVRFSATQTPVALADRGAQVFGTGDAVAYLDTLREARISSVKPEGVLLRAAKSGRVVATSASLDLATGLASFAGAGRFENLDSADRNVRAERSIGWNDSAKLIFALDEKGDPKSLRHATFHGGVEARGGQALATADAVTADFDPGFPDRPVLKQVTLTGNAGASDAQGGELRASSVLVSFAAPSATAKEPAPTRMLAQGDVRASSKGSTLRSQELEAQLGTDAEGKTAAIFAIAKQQVQITGRDGIRAECDELATDIATQNAELAGEIVVLAKGESSVTGRRMKLEGETARLEVIGEGAFHHEGVAKSGAKQVASARWTERMTYEDSTGVLEAVGGAVAEAMPDERTRDTLQAEHVTVRLTPAGDRKASLDDLQGAAGPGQKPREIVDVVAFGASDAAPAKVESRRYDGPIPEDEDKATPKLAQLLYLESREVHANNAAGTLSTPGAGKIVVVDRRDGKNEGNRSEIGTTGRGQTLFSWRDAMSMDRGTQTMRLTGAVQLTNERPGDRLITQLDCERLTATLLSQAQPSTSDPLGEGRNQLSRAIAEGNARLKSGTKELLGQIIDYDAVAAVASAGSDNGSMVTLIDQGSATPISAKSITWNIASGRVEVKSISTIVAPK